MDHRANQVLRDHKEEPGEPGAPGTAGAPGANGADGADGLASLIVTESESAGANCSKNGGQRVKTGLDVNRDGLLGITEVLSVSFVCNGLDGQDGTNGDGSGTGSGNGSGSGDGGESSPSLEGSVLTVRKKERRFVTAR